MPVALADSGTARSRGATGDPGRAAQRLAAMRSGGASAGRAAASAWP
jgi:hypothetical protein